MPTAGDIGNTAGFNYTPLGSNAWGAQSFTVDAAEGDLYVTHLKASMPYGVGTGSSIVGICDHLPTNVEDSYAAFLTSEVFTWNPSDAGVVHTVALTTPITLTAGATYWMVQAEDPASTNVNNRGPSAAPRSSIPVVLSKATAVGLCYYCNNASGPWHAPLTDYTSNMRAYTDGSTPPPPPVVENPSGNYGEELVPPKFRNLVLNPSGEATSIGNDYIASNGTVVTGSAGAPATKGTGVVEYQVLANTGLSYYFAPLGPEETVHFGGFKIPQGRTVSTRVKLRASAAVWVQVQARWLTEVWTDGQSAGLVELAVTKLGSPVSIDSSAWATIELLVPAADIPAGASHWRPLVTVYASNPDSTPNPPAIGTKVWADEFFVTDSGASLAGVAFVSGDEAGCTWEGTPNHSTSINFVIAPPVVDTAPPPDSTGDDPTGLPPSGEDAEASTDPGSTSPPSPPAPVVPDIAADDPGGAFVYGGRSELATAEDILAWRNSNRHLCLKGDIQIEDLVMNDMDDWGVVWLVSDVDGWWTTPEPDVPDVPRGWFDGSYETRGRYNARTFTVTGSFVPRSPADVALARDRLIRAVNLCHRGGWFMAHEAAPERTNTKGAKVWLAGQPLISTAGLNGKTDFSIPLRAPDSLKYSIKDGVPPGYNSIKLLTSTSSYPERAYAREYPWAYPGAVYGSTVVDVINAGNAVVWPTLKLAGPTNGALKLYNDNTGQVFRVVRKLYPGEVLVIDCFTKQVTLNGEGNFRFYLDVDVDWLMLQPGPNRLHLEEEVLGGIQTELEVQWRSGWIG